MIVCIDSYYQDQAVTTAAVMFRGWADARAAHTLVKQDTTDGGPEAYVAGQFFRRELPFLMSILQALPVVAETIIVDGYVWLDPHGKKGLGAILYDQLPVAAPVIGVAKNKLVGSAGAEVLRGGSTRPLYVTAVGVHQDQAAEHIRSMHGPHREPTLLKLADRLSRGQ